MVDRLMIREKSLTSMGMIILFAWQTTASGRYIPIATLSARVQHLKEKMFWHGLKRIAWYLSSLGLSGFK